MIVVGGMIGLGKTSLTTLLSEKLGAVPMYESVDDNPILKLFYESSEEEQEAKRYPFLLQLYFLKSRFHAIKKASLSNETVILDRSIYEDWYFANVNRELGRISETEFAIYSDLLNEMMEELETLPRKAPEIFIYLRADFDTVIERIGLRGREFEQDQGLYDYYRKLWEGYDEWLVKQYRASSVLLIDVSNIDFVNNPDHAEQLVDVVSSALEGVREIDTNNSPAM